ncbi:MAG: heparan N-sulfatase [Verrucomicrobiales bacterium]|nr:heparan N-sulfatase [Verrucomicrobiales bacterium]
MIQKSLLALAVLFSAFIGYTADKPNFVFIISDDISYDDLGCYGSIDARTPHIDSLAEEGLLFTNAYLTASSCSPSRSSIITGRYPHNNGDASELHRAISWHIPSFPGMLRDAGYYTALAGKDHMTWHPAPEGETPPTEPFDKKYGTKVKGNSGGHGYWVEAIEESPADQPFFLWLAALDAHRAWDGDREWKEDLYGPMYNPESLTLPPAFIDTPETRQDFASYLNEVTRFDYFVGQVVDRLKEKDLFKNTYLFVVADNGRPFPRAKTRLIDDGMKTYFIATGPSIQNPGARTDSLISVIDIAPTILELAGLEKAETLQGRSLTPIYEDPTASIRPYAFSEHNWHDYEAHGRSVRDGRWLYIENNRPNLALQGPADSVGSPTFQDILAAAESSEPLTPIQADILLAPRPETELYDMDGDPHQISNLAESTEYTDIKRSLSEALAKWTEKTADSVPEEISLDGFDRETGKKTFKTREDYQRPPAGADKGADKVNEDGL